MPLPYPNPVYIELRALSSQTSAEAKRTKKKIVRNPKQPKVFGVKFSVRKIERYNHVEIRDFKV